MNDQHFVSNHLNATEGVIMIKKFLVGISTTAAVLLSTACVPPSVSSSEPPGSGIRFFLDAHDITDTTISVPILITLKASALNPNLIGAFEEPDTGVSYPFRDPTTRVDLPIILTKHTPYGAPIYFPPGEIINFTITASFFGRYGTVVICGFRDLRGQEVTGTRQAAGIYNEELRNTSSIEAPGEVTCTYSGTAA
jgi:hypothetical protein